MKNSKLSNAYASMEYDGFEGIDTSKTFSGGGGIKDLSDFRLRFDGALEKRGGLELFTEFKGTVRAVYQLSGTSLLLLVNNTVYMLSLTTGEATPLNNVYTALGTASFFSFKGTVYLLDGYGLFAMVGEQFLPVEGYLPL